MREKSYYKSYREFIEAKAKEEDLSITSVRTDVSTENGVLMTPEKAARFLVEYNRGNRQISEKIVKEYAEKMKKGEWKQNAVPIVISDQGRLLDGQHRLLAVVKAEKPVIMSVSRGVNEAAWSSFDIGKRRSSADVLYSNGEKNSRYLGATLLMLDEFDEKGVVKGTRIKRNLNEKIPILLEKYEGIKTSVVFAISFSHQLKGIPASVYAFCHYLFQKIDSTASVDFWEKLKSGIFERVDDPIKALREKILSDGGNLDRSYWVFFFFKTWTYYREGKGCKRLSLGNNERYPVLK